MPIRIALLELAAFVSKRKALDEEVFQEFLRVSFGRSVHEKVLAKSQDVGWLLVLDGFDEAAIASNQSQSAQQHILVWLQKFVQCQKQHYIILTSRPSALDL